MHYLMNDTDFQKILNFLVTVKGLHKNVGRLRTFVEAIYFMAKSGCQWRLLPYYYGNWRSVHKRYNSWSKNGIWRNLFEYSKRDPDLEWVCLDSTIVRAHSCASGYEKDSQEQEALGRSKGGFGTKVHTIVDALGNPLEFILTAGQRHDITQAHALIEKITNTTVIADTAYYANHFIEKLTMQNCLGEIPPRKNSKQPRSYDKELYKERHAIECFFGKIKHFRRIFSRYD